MKILHVIFSFNRGGAESMLVDIANEQASRGHDVEVLIINSKIDEELISHFSPAVRITRFNRTEGSMPLLLLARLNFFALRRRPDAIHIHSIKVCTLLRVLKNRTFLTVHDINTPMQYANGEKMAAISDAVKDYVLDKIPTAYIKTIENGIRPEKVLERPADELHKPVRIVQVASLIPNKKGQDILIKAVDILKARGIEASVCFIGPGAALGELEKLAQERGVSDRVTFTGGMTRDEVYARLADYDIMCHPSRFEGFGLAVAEGMAAGLPLVLTEHDGPWEVADNGRLCRSFTNGDAEACADALEAVIKNYGDALRLAEEAKAYVHRRYSVKRMVDEYLDYYCS